MAETEYYTTDDDRSLAMPASSDVSYNLPTLSASRRSSGRQTPSSITPSTPLTLPTEALTDPKNHGGDNDDLDVRRFTPSLHASLVSEILALRRGLDSKHGFIERLESNVSTLRTENEGLQENLAKHTKESRAVKKQLQSIEDGTLTAIEELVKERDEANAANTELKKKVETTQKKVRNQEDELQKAHKAFELDKSQWLDERRVLERKIHVTEGRLKAVIEEVAAHQEATAAAHITQNGFDSMGDPLPALEESSPIRPSQRNSVSSLYSVRNSHQELGGVTGLSLAEELQQGEDEDADADEEDQQNDTVDDAFSEQEMAPPKFRGTRRSLYQDDKARKILGMQSHSREQSLESAASPDLKTSTDNKRHSGQFGSPKSSKRLHSSIDAHGELISGSPPGKVKQMVKRLSLKNQRASTPVPLISNSRTYRETVSGTTKYVSTGVQFSPPASPATSTSPAWNTVWDSVFGDGHTEQPRSPSEREVYHQNKRGPTSKSFQGHTRTKSEPVPGQVSSRKSVEEPPSPPASLEAVDSPALAASNAGEPSTAQLLTVSKVSQVELREASTQTDVLAESPSEEVETTPSAPTRPPPPPPLPQTVPAIAIHPPDTLDSSSTETVLPPGTRNVGCQTELNSNGTKSVAVQTEGIRVDKRAAKLPAHLLPSAISDAPVPSYSLKESPHVSETSAIKYAQNVKGKSRDVASSAPPVPPLPNIKDYDPNSADLDQSTWTRLKRSLRSQPVSDHVDDVRNAEFNESDYAPASRPSRPSKQGKYFDPPTPVPEDEKVVVSGTTGHKRGRASGGSRTSLERITRNGLVYQLPRAPNPRTDPNATAGTGSRTPSLGSNVSSNQSRSSGPPPPFAIPARSSSAGVSKYSRKKDSASPTRRNPRDSRDVSLKRMGKKPPVLRKVQSAAVLEEEKQSEDLYMMPPTPHSLVSFPYSSPRTSNVTRSNASVTNNGRAVPSGQSSILQQYGVVTPTGNASVGSSVQHSVVDAITATMIGEWMWKYVRKRKSFGVSDQSHDFSKDARHKRWVWLSPYERTIMWSTKQPNSNVALMGKNGRTYVKDETPAPKGAADIFTRSILVLTPARALKFTATTRERHYLWLTALSFLAHHTQTGPPDLNFLPPFSSPQESNSAASRSLASSSKQVHNTTLRVSKDTSARSLQSSGPVTPTIQEVDSAKDDEDEGDPDSAFAPTVPRVPVHSRKRSSTNPPPQVRNVPLVRNANALSIGSGTTSGRSSSGQAAGKSQPSSSYAPSVRNVLTLRSTGSSLKPNSINNEEFDTSATVAEGLHFNPEFTPRTSNVSEFGANNNFFDAVGMVRLDAFVSPGVTLNSKGTKSSSADGTANQSRTGSSGDVRGSMNSAGGDTEPDLPISQAFSKGSSWALQGAGTEQGSTLHGKGEGSGDSFIGPPNISRTRQGIFRRKGIFGGHADEEKDRGLFKGF